MAEMISVSGAARQPLPVNGIIFFGRKDPCRETARLQASVLTRGEKSVLNHIGEWLGLLQNAVFSTKIIGLGDGGGINKSGAKHIAHKIETACSQLASGRYRYGLPKDDKWFSEVDMEISAMLEKTRELKSQRKTSRAYMQYSLANSYGVYD